MNYCNNCGYKLSENSNFCPNCGCSFSNQVVISQNTVQRDSAGSLALVGIISFSIPIIGIILFYSYRKTNPQAARIANICTFASFILIVLILVVLKIVSSTVY